MSGYLLIVCFLVGIAFYKLSDRIRWDWRIASASLAVTLFLLNLPIFGDALAIVPIVYLTIFFGVANPRRLRLLKGADYSYGIFLYGFVIQQSWMSLGIQLHHWYWNIALSLPTAAVFAAFSWHAIEKPALKLRGTVMASERWWLRFRTRSAHSAPTQV
jgi:peptidoglycan/LPS O-acetylase OafA/YrhL